MSLTKRTQFSSSGPDHDDAPYTGVHATPEEHERWKASLRRQEAELEEWRRQNREKREDDARGRMPDVSK